MPDPAPSTVDSLVAEDQKLVTLARAARARIGADEGAAVRDLDGRTYAAATVGLASLQLSALQLAVANAVSSGAAGLEAAVVVSGSSTLDGSGYVAVRDLSATAVVRLVSVDGTVLSGQ